MRIKNVLNFRKPSKVIIIGAVMLVAVLSVGVAVNRASYNMDMVDRETYDFPNENFQQVFFECNDTPYNPEYVVISAQLMNNQNIQGLTCGTSFILVKQVSDTWNIVPFADGIGFDDIAFQIENGMSFDYSVRPEMFTEKLDEGNYRIVTEVWCPAKHTVWADFIIDKNAPRQETYEFTIPRGVPIKTYSLENPTERQKFERLSSVNLYSDGTAWLATPPISSYMLPNCTYAFADGELLIYASIEAEELENAFGIKNGEVIARFTVVDDNTLIFKSATVPLFADEGAQYISADLGKPPSNTISAKEYPSPLKQLSMINRNTGWAITDENEILFTQNEGDIWDTVLELNSLDRYSDDFVSGFFLDESTAYIAFFSNDNQNIEVHYTKDKGATWRKTLIPYREYGGPNQVFINFIDSSNGYLLYCSDPGAGLMNKILFYTKDGGATFEKLVDLSGEIKGYPTGIAFSSDKQGFISSTYHGNEDKYLYITKDSGNTWESIKLPDYDKRRDYSYIDGYPPVFFGTDKQEGILMLKSVSDDINFVVYHTKDGGTTWNPESLLDYDIQNYSFYHLESGYFVDSNGAVFMTTALD